MSATLEWILIAVAGLLVFSLIYIIVVCCKSFYDKSKYKKAEQERQDNVAVSEPQPVYSAPLPPVEQPIENNQVEPVAQASVVEETPAVENEPVEEIAATEPEPVAQEPPYISDEHIQPEEGEVQREFTIGDLDLEDNEDDREIFGKSRSFVEKMMDLDVRSQEYYDELNNEFLSYKNIHARISQKCMSYRMGRKLIAKITARGKTMKLHLALDVAAYPENIYFQKDMSDLKSYAETPFTVKVKSDRGLKRSIDLIAELSNKEGFAKKSKYEPKDSMEEVRALYLEQKKLEESQM